MTWFIQKKTWRSTWNIIPWKFGSDSFSFTKNGWLICRFQAFIFLGWNTKKIKRLYDSWKPAWGWWFLGRGPRPGPRLGPHFSRWTFLRIARLQRLRILWRESYTCHLIPSSCFLDWKKHPVGFRGFHRFTKDFRYLNWWYWTNLKAGYFWGAVCVLHKPYTRRWVYASGLF